MIVKEKRYTSGTSNNRKNNMNKRIRNNESDPSIASDEEMKNIFENIFNKKLKGANHD